MAASITVVYNNLPGAPGFVTAWGLSYLIKTEGTAVLFDTGGDPNRLESNLNRLEIEPGEIDAMVLSHLHTDHCGGIGAVLRPGLPVYVLPSFPAGLKASLDRKGAKVIEANRPTALSGGIWTTGEVNGFIPEQALVVATSRGLIVVVGCSHPGVVRMCRRAQKAAAGPIHLLTGGFHLSGASSREVQAVIDGLKSLGVEKIAPNHCTGSRTMETMEKTWGDDFLHLGTGETYTIPGRPVLGE